MSRCRLGDLSRPVPKKATPVRRRKAALLEKSKERGMGNVFLKSRISNNETRRSQFVSVQ